MYVLICSSQKEKTSTICMMFFFMCKELAYSIVIEAAHIPLLS